MGAHVTYPKAAPYEVLMSSVLLAPVLASTTSDRVTCMLDNGGRKRKWVGFRIRWQVKAQGSSHLGSTGCEQV